MKDISGMTLGELAARVADHLRQNGINVILTGGSCVSIYTENRYMSYDLDFVEEVRADRKKIARVLAEIGFTPRERYFVHPDTPFFVEFPAGPLAVGDEPVQEISQLEFATGLLRLLSPTDCIKDRLAHYFHWQDRQCLDQAAMVARSTTFDLLEIERWSIHEGMGDEFQNIRELFLMTGTTRDISPGGSK